MKHSAIFTRYAGPTRSTGSRIIVKNMETGEHKSYGVDNAYSIAENHKRALQSFLRVHREFPHGQYHGSPGTVGGYRGMVWCCGAETVNNWGM